MANFEPAVKKDGTMLSGCYTSLQSEGHPVEFRNVRLLPLIGCMEPGNPAYRDYFVESDPSQCQ